MTIFRNSRRTVMQKLGITNTAKFKRFIHAYKPGPLRLLTNYTTQSTLFQLPFARLHQVGLPRRVNCWAKALNGFPKDTAN